MTMWKVGLVIGPLTIVAVAYALYRQNALSRFGLAFVTAIVIAIAALLASM